MKDTLRPGVSRTNRITVDRDRTIGFMGEEARVYATPRLVSDIEMTCRNLLLEHCDAGEDSVGVEVALKHLAADARGHARSRSRSTSRRSTAARSCSRSPPRTRSSRSAPAPIRASSSTLDKRIERLRAKAGKARRSESMSSGAPIEPAAVRHEPMADEQLILVDERNRAVGTAGKDAVHRTGSPASRLLDLHRRRARTDRCCSSAACGNIIRADCGRIPAAAIRGPGERTVTAAHRRLHEELGITSTLSFGFFARYHADLDHGMQENEFVYVYLRAAFRRAKSRSGGGCRGANCSERRRDQPPHPAKAPVLHLLAAPLSRSITPPTSPATSSKVARSRNKR